MRALNHFLLLLVIATPVRGGWLTEDADIMGTRITVELFHPDPAIAQQGIDTVLQEMRRIDTSMSPYIATSELARLNVEAQHKAFGVSDELFALIQRSQYFSDLTGGAFDITFASVVFLYDYRNAIKPDDSQRWKAAELINYHNLILSESGNSVAFSKPDVRIDLGGIAKGYAVDRCILLLQ